MAEIKSFPNNQDEFIGAENVMRWLHGRTSGVFGADGNASVAPVPDSMPVTVSDGNGWISNDNADGVVWWIDNESALGSKLQLSVDMSDSVFPRIDRVVVSWQTTNYVARPEVSILKGTPASNPVAPALTNDNVLRQISLAAINIPAGATSITYGMITDERLNPDVCGLVTCGIGIDTTVMQEQFSSFLERIQDELADLEAGTAVELKKLSFSDTIVSASSFSEVGTYEAYPFRAAVPLSGVVSSMIPEVVFSLEDSISGVFAPISETYNGGLYIYATEQPENSITIPTIICWRGNA